MRDGQSPPWDIKSLAPDVAILIALPEEFQTLADAVVGDCFAVQSKEFIGYNYFFLGPGGYRCVATIMAAMGPTPASQSAQQLLALKPALLVNIGIAGGFKDDLRIGDVIVPREVAAYDETGKVKGRLGEEPWQERRGSNYRPTSALVALAPNFPFAYRKAFERWTEAAVQDLNGLLPTNKRAPLDRLLDKGAVRAAPRISTKHLASGSFVVASKPFADWIRAANADIHAGEMEAAGMLTANESRREPAQSLVIRGISDHVDYDKKAVDAIGDGALRGLAMRNAWRLLSALMELELLPRAEPKPSTEAQMVIRRELRTTPRFVGRQPELAELERLFLDQPEPKTIAVISGMPGVGKSYLADHFARTHADAFSNRILRLVLHPEERRSPEAVAEELASKFDPEIDRKQLPAQIPGVLLLIENVDSETHAKLVADLLESFPAAKVIISGRVREFGSARGWPQIRLDRLDEATALELFAAWGCTPNTTPDRAALAQLAKHLDYLPLALTLAAGYLQAGLSLTDFEDELHSSKLRLKPRDPAALADEEQTARWVIQSSFALSLDLFEHAAGADACKALTCLGSALRQEFGQSLGRRVAGLNQKSFRQLCMTATQLSLLDCTKPSMTAPRFKFHPLIAEFLANEFDDDDQAFARLRAWFEPRMLEPESDDRDELVDEQEALVAWLDRVPSSLAPELSAKYKDYGHYNGPYIAFASLHERAFEAASDRSGRSIALSRLAFVLRHAGELDRSIAAARAMAELCGDEDPQGRAIALGLVADILFVRGELDEALRIRIEEELPVYERLGDIRSRAVAVGLVADILFARGELDEALRIRTEEELPVYERLGDIRDRAVTLGKVADILFARGDPDEALRIRTEEQLPVYERLGDIHSLLIARAHIARYMATRNHPGDLQRAITLLETSVDQARHLQLRELPDLESFLDHLRQSA